MMENKMYTIFLFISIKMTFKTKFYLKLTLKYFQFLTAETLRLSQSRDIPWYHGISRDITWSRVISRVMDRDITWSRVISRDFAWWTVISRDITFKLFFHFLQKKIHKFFFKFSFNLIFLTKTNSLFSY